MSDPVLPQGLPASTPLSEIPPDALEELFARDPLKLSDADVLTLIQHFRNERHNWARLEAEGKTRKKAKGKAGAKGSADASINMDEILNSL